MHLWQKQASTKWLAQHADFLEKFGPENVAVITRPGRVRNIVQVFCATRLVANELERKFGGDSSRLSRDWLSDYQSPGLPLRLRVGKRLLIVNDETATPSATRLIIPAAGAFGTGEHATTAMSLRLLEQASRELRPGWKLLDAGTGTGILALAARRLGAREVTGLDHDPRAVAHARQNARRNAISRARFVASDVLEWRTEIRFEIITANLFSDLLIAALPLFRRVLAGGGRLILSGILREQSGQVERALRQRGFEMERKRRRGKWIALQAVRAAKLS